MTLAKGETRPSAQQMVIISMWVAQTVSRLPLIKQQGVMVVGETPLLPLLRLRRRADPCAHHADGATTGTHLKPRGASGSTEHCVASPLRRVAFLPAELALGNIAVPPVQEVGTAALVM